MRELDRYEVLETLAEGSLGTTYRAFDTRRRQVLLLKILRLDRLHELSSADVELRFASLSERLRQLSHPGVVPLLDIQLDGRTVFLMSEFIEGESIDAVVRRERLSEAQAAGITVQLLDALDYMHGKGVVHEDLKPRNVLIDGEGKVRITDFGLAPFGARTSQETGLLVGSMEYMAPEQFRGDDPTPRTDVHAAGIILYQLLTGISPFADPHNFSMHLVIKSVPPPPSRAMPGVGSRLDAVVARALEKRPSARYPSARDMRAAVAAAVGGGLDPVTAARPRRTPARAPDARTTVILDRRAVAVPVPPPVDSATAPLPVSPLRAPAAPAPPRARDATLLAPEPATPRPPPADRPPPARRTATAATPSIAAVTAAAPERAPSSPPVRPAPSSAATSHEDRPPAAVPTDRLPAWAVADPAPSATSRAREEESAAWVMAPVRPAPSVASPAAAQPPVPPSPPPAAPPAPIAAPPSAPARRRSAPRPLTPQTEQLGGRALNRYLGPIATVICRRAAKEARDEAHYFELLAAHLKNGTERARFLDDVNGFRH